MDLAQADTVATVHRDASRSTRDRFCVIGAGSTGLAVAKNLRHLGIACDCLERGDSIGGNWCFGQAQSSVYRSTRLISSKRLTEYTDFPMPDDFPDQPHHELVRRYLESYAEHFDLLSSIHFQTAVRSLEPASGGGWFVATNSGERHHYRGVVIANGHNWDPRWPVLPGRFDGDILHSAEYKVPDILTGRRVLVVGGGNSGFDIAAESARHAAATFHSLRRQYHVLPRFFRGQPIDECGEWMLEWRLPLWLRRMSAGRVRRKAWPARRSPRLPRPDHRMFETHPVINSTWPSEVASGKITIEPDVRELDGTTVRFADRTRKAIDVIVCATGYRISFPFISAGRLNWRDGRPNLFLNIFHPDRDDLFVAGLIQPDSGQFGLVDYQSQLIAAYIAGLGADTAAAHQFREVKHQRAFPSRGSGIRYVDSPRHLVEVEHASYRRQLRHWIERLRADQNVQREKS